MTEYTDPYTDPFGEVWRKAQSGKPRHLAIYVSADLDVEVLPPDDVNKAGLIRILENEDETEVMVWPGEVPALVAALLEAVLTLVEWRTGSLE